MERRLVLVSNRGPVAYERAASGRRVARRGDGGMVSALSLATDVERTGHPAAERQWSPVSSSTPRASGTESVTWTP